MTIEGLGFRDLMARMRAGCPDAARRLFHDYSACVTKVLRARLNPTVRRMYDTADLHQSVFASFFQAPPERFDFETSKDLVRYLVAIAKNKAIDLHRKRVFCRTRSLRREATSKDSDGFLESAGAERTPSGIVMANEEWEALIGDLSPCERQAMQMLRDNYSYREIRQQTGMGEKTIQRLVRRIRERGNCGSI
jgi:RNA polymerase sigma factor (sigma-70 family)